MTIPDVSVVMPVFNGERYLKESLESVFSQSHRNFELIVVDDGSSDSTPEILKSYVYDSRLRIFTRPHLGICAALNLGLNRAKAEYIARFDADDLMMPQRLERQLQFLEQHSSLAGAASEYYIIDQNGAAKGMKKIPLYTLAQVRDYLESGAHLIFPHPTMMFRRDSAAKIGGYRHKFETCEDVDLFLRMIDSGQFIVVQPEALIQFRYHSSSISATNITRQFHLKQIIFDNYRRRRSGLPELEVSEYFAGIAEQSFLSRCQTAALIQSAILMRRAEMTRLRGSAASAFSLTILAAVLNPPALLRKSYRTMANLTCSGKPNLEASP